MIFIDTETCGLVGPAVLIQYAYDDGPVILHEVWHESSKSTLQLLEMFCDNDICGFNLTFDWFHIVKLYNILHSLQDRTKPPTVDNICRAIKDKPTYYCLKPRKALDLFLHARKGEWQSLLDRKDIKIK